ncbi:MAG: hypothetical protein LUI12_01920 [Clostridiales bacterium]|nr:hypothetical protein [Clostridiales bacterium]
MSIQQVLEQQGISKEEFETVLKIRKITDKGNSCEIKRKTGGGLTVYEVRKEKK